MSVAVHSEGGWSSVPADAGEVGRVGVLLLASALTFAGALWVCSGRAAAQVKGHGRMWPAAGIG